jgi:capsular polysaccharide transport system permease protein
VVRDFCEKQLSEALSFLEKSRDDAQRQQLYLQRVVEPNLPDVAMEPKRAFGILAVVVLGFVVWGILSLFVAGVREHQQ